MYVLIEVMLPNFAVEWLALLIFYREVPSSNIGPETDHTD